MKRIASIVLALLVTGFLTACGSGQASGFIKSWDTAYMQSMLDVTGTYPNQYTRFYAGQLLEKQGEGEIDALTGATSSYGSFQKLMAAVLEQAGKGDSSIVYVDTGH